MSRTSELLCSDTRALLARLLEGELEGDERSRVERHLEGCPTCASEARSAEQALSALRGLPEEERARLRDSALRELGIEEEPILPSRRTRLLRFVAFAILFVLFALYLRQRHEHPVETPRGVETR